MFFVAAKVLWFLATPSNLLSGLALAGLLAAGGGLNLAAWGWRVSLGALLCLLFLGLGPAANWLLLPLEGRFRTPPPDGPVDGVVVLGGAVRANASFAHDQLDVGEAGERVIAMADLARRHPAARIVFSGGSGSLVADEPAEADALDRFGGALGLEPGRVQYESRSRTTWENAAFSRDLVQPKPGERWLLVTSAWHMPRAIGAFRQAGFAVVPYPVDFLTEGRRDLWRLQGNVAGGLGRFDTAFKEWLGLFAYRLSGRSDALLPG